MNRRRAFAWILPLAAVGFASSVIPWEDLTEGDWLYALATRFAHVDGHTVHYPTPTAELAKLLEGRTDPGALRQLAEARLALGDRKGAQETMERWAQAAGPEAWAETARWMETHSEPAAAFRAAEKALPGLGAEARLALSDERIAWAEAHPDLADALAFRKAKAEAFPQDPNALEAWLRALEKAGRLAEADQALAAAPALPPERRLLVRSDLRADHGDLRGAQQILDGAVMEPWSLAFSRAYARRTDQGTPTAPGAWRATLENHYDAGALTRLFITFQGRDQAPAATDLLRQVERRYEKGLGRADELLLSRLYASVDAIPEAFRAGLAAAHLGSSDEQTGDLASLAQLALRAGGRPLAWGSYNDEAYHWVAAVDRTPGFGSGGLSFLLTGLPWKETLDNLENASLPERTFATARALAEALAQRAPRHPALPALRVALMARHVERGEGAQALALLPLLENGPAEVADQARRQALLAARQVSLPPGEELRLMKARMRFAAPDGSRPTLGHDYSEYTYEPPDTGEARAWARLQATPRSQGYGHLLNECLSRLDQVDGSHTASVDLVLTELDRLPDAEALWLDLASRLEGWNLDDGLGPRYQAALQRFQDPGIWDKAARWYARRNYHAELRQLASQVTARFRGSELFRRGGADVAVQVPDQPPVAGGVRMVLWADWVRLRALERFPHSPQVFREARRLVTPAQWQAHYDPAKEAQKPTTRVIVPEALMAERSWAVLFVDEGQREAWFAEAMRHGTLQSRLEALEGRTDRTPVEDLLLFEGWSRLSRYERAVDAGERLCRAYPGDGALAQRVLTLHRSLNGLETSHAAPARALVERTAPALENPNALWTELGEMEEDRGRGEAALVLWRNLLARDPRDPEKIAELATLLWDYNHDREALAVVEAGRKALGRPRFYAFETGVLRENLHDLDGAVREYLDATRPEASDRYDSSFENDQRSLRRLAQLLARPKVYALVERRIRALAPGNAEDEKTLAAFFPLGTIEPPAPGLSWDADTWIDALDHPNDPEGRAQRAAHKEAQRPGEFDAIRRMGDGMLEKVQQMVPRATTAGFLDFAEQSTAYLAQERLSKDHAIDLKGAILARRAQLAPAEEEGIRLDMERARYLAANARVHEADAVWATLGQRLDKLPEGTVRLRAESERAAYLERAKGIPAAAAEWRSITRRHPWSLGLLEDRLAFLERAHLGEEGRALLEETVPRAASGHRENLLERLTRDALTASDFRRARRAVEQLLAGNGLEDARRLAGVHLLARLSFRQDPAWDPFPLAQLQGPLLKPEAQGDLYHELARAADLESAPARGVALWVEALNRRTERDWILEAARSTQRSGKGPELLAFFEKQRERSPRDMRWTVAVRDIKRTFHDVEGTIEAAKAAVAVRPELELLWRDAAEILVRADRPHEAADFLEGWHKPRPASEDVARWRSELYARGGDPERALAVEQDTLRALAREGSADAREREDRKARAAGRLFHLGYPELAVRLYSPKGDIGGLLGASRVGMDEKARIALLVGQFPRVLSACGGNDQALRTAGLALAEYGRPDQKEEIQAWLLRAIHPIREPRPDTGALNRWWPFIGASRLEPGLRIALAQRGLGGHPGPWQTDPPFPFLQALGQALIGAQPNGALTFHELDLPAFWAADLARRDRSEELMAFVEPRWQELLAQVKGPGPVGGTSARQGWTYWLDEPAVLGAWARAAANHGEKLRELGEVMGERRLWDRFWALGARGWSADTLVAILPEAPRTAWFRFWTTAENDPVLVARRNLVERVDTALARLVQGASGSGDDPLVDKLRGPRTVGEVLGKDARWTWPEFNPRRDARGEITEKGDDRIAGQGVDRGRVPGALWGEAPGEAWYVLEALARYRKGDATAPYLPLEAPTRGAETQRALLAMRLARALGDLPLALAIADAHRGPAKDRTWMEGRLSLLAASGHQPQAHEEFRTYLRAIQAGLTEADYKDLSVLASRLALSPVLEALDPAQPVGPVFLAYLQDQRPEAARAFHTANEVDFRTALTNRWEAREGRLTQAQANYWLHELWATGSARLSRRMLNRLGPVWTAAGTWLEPLPVPERPGALAALEEALNPAQAHPALLAQLTQPGAPDAHRLLALRLRLARHETEAALALVDAMIAETRTGAALAYEPPVPQAAPGAEGGSEGEGEAEGNGATPELPSGDALVTRLEAWLAPFQAAGSARPVEERFLKLLTAKRREGQVPADAWRLAFRLTPAAEAAPLVRELEEAWFRGELTPYELGPVLETAAPALGADLATWMARWPENRAFESTRLRVVLLQKVKQNAEAARVLLAGRARSPWTTQEEARAFDLWRRLGAPALNSGGAPAPGAPAYWTGSAAVWSGATPLGERLKAHGHDLLAARAALRNLGPGEDSALARAAFILETDRTWGGEGEGDLTVLRLRAARGLLKTSSRAALTALGSPEPPALARLLGERKYKTADINAVLADLARLGRREGRETLAKGCLALLADRNAPGLKALQDELAPAPGRAEAFRLEDGKPVPIRPKDLTWALLTHVLNKEGK